MKYFIFLYVCLLREFHLVIGPKLEAIAINDFFQNQEEV